MDAWVLILVPAISTVIASSGFWAFLKAKDTKKKEVDHLLMGLAYDRIIAMGFGYIERGWITGDEYDDYQRLLYKPYKALGGNGVTDRIMAEVANLPIRSRASYAVILREAKTRSPIYDQPLSDTDAGVLVE
jgi:hypothetical protein